MGHLGDPLVLAAGVHWFGDWSLTGNFTTLDLIALTANALGGALLLSFRTSRSSFLPPSLGVLSGSDRERFEFAYEVV